MSSVHSTSSSQSSLWTSLFTAPLPASSSSEPFGTCPFKTGPTEDLNARSLISYVPWTKAERWARKIFFPKVTEDPHRFAEEFNIVIQTYQPGFSDLYQLVHMLVSKHPAQRWMNQLAGMILQNLSNSKWETIPLPLTGLGPGNYYTTAPGNP